ncbi:MAG: hypothetical protein EOO38_14310 [Cytophagaceae bacterium]|nr:MAG: hypothetical protein EOO38_14310 [Cytophagaceae bacterium]
MMTPAHILEELWRAGLSVTLTETDQLKIQPASHMQPAQRELLLANKAEIVAFLHEARATTRCYRTRPLRLLNKTLV